MNLSIKSAKMLSSLTKITLTHKKIVIVMENLIKQRNK